MKDFLQFNGHQIFYSLIDGEWWVAIKPLCEALEINYNRQAQNIRADEILSELVAKQQLVAADNSVRSMICLPEQFIYGWLFSVRSASPALKQYKLECYKILYKHFHGTLIRRKEALLTMLDEEKELIELETRLMETENFQRYKELQRLKRQRRKSLKDIDEDLMNQQTTMSF